MMAWMPRTTSGEMGTLGCHWSGICRRLRHPIAATGGAPAGLMIGSYSVTAGMTSDGGDTGSSGGGLFAGFA